MSDNLKELEIIRTEYLKDCVRGIIRLDGERICYSLELPYINDEHDISAIPIGVYEVIPYNSRHFGEVFQILNVPGREGILIHPGNTAKDTKGCVIVGEKFGNINGEPAVMNSKIAFNKLKQALKNVAKFRVKVMDNSK